MTRTAVQIVDNPRKVRLLADPVRREIIRQLTPRPQTQNQLARELELRPSSISHHLKLLREAGFIKIGYSEVGPHGILQKFYEPTSNLFIEDFKEAPRRLQKYFVHTNIERLRGALSIVQMLAEKKNRKIEITTEELRDMAQEIANRLPIIAKKYEKTKTNSSTETINIRIYSETLKSLMTDRKWGKVFQNMINESLT
ncbi:MAG: helix-turn-helix domain-containing protein [Candidatus Bathyarchaeota archaeon]|nr:helix-turn-helix domain-containing protein [Candidatus Bathyarchaeota archaeon]MDH5753885.1 helix-turn-helix domain-containing protein [Candidatus Bathyarchaeota archaeon]